jgi:hypothetical protein
VLEVQQHDHPLPHVEASVAAQSADAAIRLTLPNYQVQFARGQRQSVTQHALQ